MPATVTTDFREEFEAESARRLRRRFLWYSGVALFLGFLGFVTVLFLLLLAPDEVKVEAWVILLASFLSMIPYIWAFTHALRHKTIKRKFLISVVYWLLIMSGVINLGLAPFSQRVSEAVAIDQQQKIRAKQARAESEPALPVAADPQENNQPEQIMPAADPDTENDPGEPSAVKVEGGKIVLAEEELPGGAKAQFTVGQTNMGIGSMWMFNLFVSHFFAALFIPWTPREAISPLIPLLTVNAAAVIGFKLFGGNEDTWLTLVVAILLSPLIGVPGTLICWWRHSRFRNKFHYAMLRGRYGEIKQELTDARRIHEALFPEPIIDGPVRMDFVYQPMRQIGGDYFFTKHIAREDGSSVLNLILIDVTGHGLTAALTVNRLAGEIQREFGENPDVSPADILRGLNNYIHHTLALHSVYATAKAIKVDTREDTILWASAGHPPAFLRAVDGTIERIESTALVLGACLGDDFVVEQCEHRFGRGDTLLLYTDGATEARNNDGKMMSVRGLEAILANGRPAEHGGWSATVMEHVDSYRSGPADDDTLLVEVYRPLHS